MNFVENCRATMLGARSVRIREVEGSNPFGSTTNEADGLHRLLHCLFSGQGYRRNVALPLVSYALLGQVAEKTLGTPVKV